MKNTVPLQPNFFKINADVIQKARHHIKLNLAKIEEERSNSVRTIPSVTKPAKHIELIYTLCQPEGENIKALSTETLSCASSPATYSSTRAGKAGKPLSDAEISRFKDLLDFVGKRLALEPETAVKRLTKCAVDHSLQSHMQQAHQLATFERLLVFVKKVEQANLSILSSTFEDVDTPPGVEIQKNKYSHYIRGDNGEKPHCAAQAVNMVVQRVTNDLVANNGRLRNQTVRDIAALTTLISAFFYSSVADKIKFEGLFDVFSTHGAEIENYVKKIDFVKKFYDLSGQIDSDLSKNLKFSKATKKAVLDLEGQLKNRPELKSVLEGFEKKYPDKAQLAWDQFKRRGIDIFWSWLQQNSNSPCPEIDLELSKLSYPRSMFGPSLTIWHTVNFMAVMLGATREEQKVYAVAQASDWMENNFGYGKSARWDEGPYTELEALMTFAYAVGSGVDDARPRETLIRLFMAMSIAIEDGELQALPISAEDKNKGPLDWMLDRISSQADCVEMLQPCVPRLHRYSEEPVI